MSYQPFITSVRRFPYPYRAMLAICSDLDETPDRKVYWEIMRFLNTTETTAMGPGVGLDVGNSIYFDMPPEQFSYWNTDDAGREMVRSLIHSGHIDCLHSYGDLAITRAHAGRALDELARHDCRLEIWVDHGKAPTNFGADVTRGYGDIPGHEAYHADLTIAHGVRYVWRGRVTSVIGQDVPASIDGLWTSRHPVASGWTVGKELAKRVLARRGSVKYAIQADNQVLGEGRLRDGEAVDEFLRCNPHWGGVSSCETATGIGEVLTDSMLGRLVMREGVCILYTHLGKVKDPRTPFPPAAVAGLRRLAKAHRDDKILVTTTRRALGYLSARDRVGWSGHREKDLLTISVGRGSGARSGGPPNACSELMGLSFYVPDHRRYRILIDGAPVESLQVNPPDRTGRPSVSLPWKRSCFPDQ